MKRYLLLGLALILANNFTPAKACNSYVGITNGSGSPLVVYGNTVDVEVGVPAGFQVIVDLDGNEVFETFNPNSMAVVVTGSITAAYGSHVLDSNDYPIDFTAVVPPPAPGTPALSGPSMVQSNALYTLSWTVPSGSIQHYTLSKSVAGNPPTTSVIAVGTTSETTSSPAPAGTDHDVDYMVRACSSSDESVCSSWSNTVAVDVSAPCVIRCP